MSEIKTKEQLPFDGIKQIDEKGMEFHLATPDKNIKTIEREEISKIKKINIPKMLDE